MKNLFRPVFLFPDQYVDLSILMAIVVLVVINLFLFPHSPVDWVTRGAIAGVLLGIGFAGWEWFWHARSNHQKLRPSFVYHNMTVALLLIGFLGGDGLIAGLLSALLFFRIVVFAALLVVQFQAKTRYRWADLFPKETVRKIA